MQSKISMEEIRAKCKKKLTALILDPALLEVQKSQREQLPDVQDLKEEEQVNSLRRLCLLPSSERTPAVHETA